ncbi:MAG TPA: LamG-like jellyroll fold domain-containing protein, partial [Nakamurella sp.]
TDVAGKTSTVVHTIYVGASTGTPYAQSVLTTPGLINYWRMGDPVGSNVFADAQGSATAGAQGGVVQGQPGAITNDSTTSTVFDGTSGAASAPLNLSSDGQLTIEFWMKWNAYVNNDALALEFTPNFNNNPGGFLVDPNAGEQGGQFGVGIGSGSSRNNVYFPRPSAGAWHYYTIVINTAAPAATQITPYVDGQPVTYTKTASGTGAGNFATSSLYWFSRDANALFGAGGMQDLALYQQLLGANVIASHYRIGMGAATVGQPDASFTVSPSTITAGTAVTFNGAASSSPDGTITDYKWDLDGSGNFATDSGSSATLAHTFTTPGSIKIGLKVTDSRGATDTSTQTIDVGAAMTTNYAKAVTGTAGLVDYWRMGDTSGTAMADPIGSAAATLTGGAIPGQPGALTGDSTKSTSFDGLAGAASAPVNLSADSKLTIEFWMNWNAFADNDALAMELTPNFNNNAGGFLIDPNASGPTQFGVAIGQGDSRNNVYFARPSAGAWHHYAFVIDTTAAGASEITPYIDGQPVTFTKTAAGTGAGNFAHSTLYWFSRAATSLFAAGSMQDLALYNTTLSAASILNHYTVGTAG